MYFTFGNLFKVCYMLYVFMSVCLFVCLSVCLFYIHRFSTNFYGPYVA